MSMAKRIVSMIAVSLSLTMLIGCHPIFPPALTTTSRISLQSADPNHEGRYVVAQGKDDNWSLTQRPEPSDCAWFTLYDLGKDALGNRKIALKTCHDRFVTVPRGDPTRPDKRLDTRRERMAWQESRPGDCALFTLEDQGDGTVAFKTCGGRYLTAGDAGPGWEPPLEWGIIVENPVVEGWEKYKLSPAP
jgi:hypothetical protein